MEEVISSGTCSEFKDLEAKLGMKTPESLLRAMREDYTSSERALDTDEKLQDSVILPLELLEKIKNLKTQMEQLRSADVKILRQLLSLHEGMEMLRWLQGDRSTLTSLTSSLTGSQSSLGEVATVAQEPGGDICCLNTQPETTLGSCPSPPEFTQCSTSFEDSDGMSDQASSAISNPTAKITSLHENFTGLTVVLEDLKDIPLSSPPVRLAQSKGVKGEVFGGSEGGVQSAQYAPELSLGQSEALLGYDTHWCWVESKDDVTFL